MLVKKPGFVFITLGSHSNLWSLLWILLSFLEIEQEWEVKLQLEIEVMFWLVDCINTTDRQQQNKMEQEYNE